MALDLPAVGGDPDSWGSKLNAALNLLDSRSLAASASATSAQGAADGASSAASALNTRVTDLEEFEGPAGNVFTMPDWDGTGAHPTRPIGLPSGTRVVWPQPSAPLTAPGYALPGDRWEAIDL